MFFWRRVAPQIPEEGLKPTATPSYTRNFRDLNKLVARGKSFSGYERNSLFLNQAGQGFVDIAELLGVDYDDDARAVASVDWDHDGDLDLWITNRTAPQVRLLRNDLSTDNGFLAVRLIGNGTTTNRDAVGARLTLTEQSGATQIRTVHAGDGFLAQSSSWTHFGMGQYRDVVSLAVAWPGGSTQTFSNLQVGKHYTITQGDVSPTGWSRQSPVKLGETTFAATSKAPGPSRNGFWVANRLPFPRLNYVDGSGVARSTDDFRGKPVLVNIWATWCVPCVEELSMFGTHARQIRESGAEVLALNVDRLSRDGQTAASQDKIEQLLARVGYDLPYGVAQDDNLAKIEVLIEYLSSRRSPLSIPTSFLLDAEGQVAAVYLEPVSWKQLSVDLKLLTANANAQLARATPRSGRWMADPRKGLAASTYLSDYATLFATNGFPQESERLYQKAKPTGQTESARAFYNQAKSALQQGRKQQAIEHYQSALRLDPNYGAALTGLGAIFLMDQQVDVAQKLFERALNIDPNHATALVNLAMIDQSRGDRTKALERLRAVVARNPGFAQAQLNLGSLLASMKDYESARTHLLKAVEADPKLLPAHMNLAFIHTQKKQWKESEKRYRRALQLNPRTAFAYFGLGNALAQQQRHKEAASSYRQAIKLGYQKANVFTRLGKSLLQQGDSPGAVAALKRALELDPQDAEAKRVLNGVQ